MMQDMAPLVAPWMVPLTHRSSDARADNALRSVLVKVMCPNIFCPLNLSTRFVSPFDDASRYGLSIW